MHKEKDHTRKEGSDIEHFESDRQSKRDEERRRMVQDRMAADALAAEVKRLADETYVQAMQKDQPTTIEQDCPLAIIYWETLLLISHEI